MRLEAGPRAIIGRTSWNFRPREPASSLPNAELGPPQRRPCALAETALAFAFSSGCIFGVEGGLIRARTGDQDGFGGASEATTFGGRRTLQDGEQQVRPLPELGLPGRASFA